MDTQCLNCGSSFEHKSKAHKFCCEQCKSQYKYKDGTITTEKQYQSISGNWRRYCQRLLYVAGKKRKDLTVEMLLELLERQSYRCALSGVQLTCNLSKGKRHGTNVSIDRIDAGGPYTIDNVQLVCRDLNHWRADTTVDVFVDWCRKVVNYHDQQKQGLSCGVRSVPNS